MGIYSDYKKDENERLEPKRRMLRHIIMMDLDNRVDDQTLWDLVAKAERWDSTEQDFENLYKYMDTMKGDVV